MPIAVQCQCGQKFNAKDELAGKRLKCPKRSSAINVPRPQSKAKAAATSAGKLRVQCKCGKRYQIASAMQGKNVKCTACGAGMKIPASDSTPTPQPQTIDRLDDPLGLGASDPFDDPLDDAALSSAPTSSVPLQGSSHPQPTAAAPTSKSSMLPMILGSTGAVVLLGIVVCGVGAFLFSGSGGNNTNTDGVSGSNEPDVAMPAFPETQQPTPESLTEMIVLWETNENSPSAKVRAAVVESRSPSKEDMAALFPDHAEAMGKIAEYRKQAEKLQREGSGTQTVDIDRVEDMRTSDSIHAKKYSSAIDRLPADTPIYLASKKRSRAGNTMSLGYLFINNHWIHYPGLSGAENLLPIADVVARRIPEDQTDIRAASEFDRFYNEALRDTSLLPQQYYEAGMPKPDKVWSHFDLSNARRALSKISQTHGNDKLLRSKGVRSQEIFDRMVSPENLASIADTAKPTEQQLDYAAKYVDATTSLLNFYEAEAKKQTGAVYSNERVQLWKSMAQSHVVLLEAAERSSPGLRDEGVYDPLAGRFFDRMIETIGVGNFDFWGKSSLIDYLEQSAPEIVPFLSKFNQDQLFTALRELANDPGMKGLKSNVDDLSKALRKELVRRAQTN